MIKGYTSGAMDLLHAGHLLHLKTCREQCDFLIVGLHVDPSIETPGKLEPIETTEERLIRLEGCRYVDQVIIYHTEAEQSKLLAELKPDIRFKGGDHKGEPCTGHPYKLVFTDRDHNYSTGNLRLRIWDAEKEVKRGDKV